MSELHNPATGTAPAPTSQGATIRLHPAGTTLSIPQAVSRSFRRNFLDRQDPFETAGQRIEKFTFSGSYELRDEPPEQVAGEIRTELVEQLVQGNLAEARVEVVDYNDAGLENEPARRFVITQTDTHRRTLVTVNAYLQPYGRHLYYSVRSYILPPLSIWKLLMWLLFTDIVLARADDVARGVGIYSRTTPTILALIAIAVVFRKLIRNLLAGDAVLTALRKQFPSRFDWGTFNGDDVAAFLKTSLGLTLGTIATVLERHGINTSGLQTVIANLHQHNHVDTGGGSIVGAVIGGFANRASGQVGR